MGFFLWEWRQKDLRGGRQRFEAGFADWLRALADCRSVLATLISQHGH